MKKMLFVCMGNSCRSQMAEGFARHLGGQELEMKSAGIMPDSSISRKAAQVMAEKDIDISAQYPKPLFSEDLEWADKIILMGHDVQDPQLDLAGYDTENWHIDDPIGEPVDRYRETRDEIEIKVKDLLERLWIH